MCVCVCIYILFIYIIGVYVRMLMNLSSLLFTATLHYSGKQKDSKRTRRHSGVVCVNEHKITTCTEDAYVRITGGGMYACRRDSGTFFGLFAAEVPFTSYRKLAEDMCARLGAIYASAHFCTVDTSTEV